MSDLSDFLPYLLNQAAETVSAQFQPYYRDRYGMLRTEWRVLFHLGNRGNMTAKQICDIAVLHKTKVSRAVRALEEKGFLKRANAPQDRRAEILSLTRRGHEVYADLSSAAKSFETQLGSRLSKEDIDHLRGTLKALMRS